MMPEMNTTIATVTNVTTATTAATTPCWEEEVLYLRFPLLKPGSSEFAFALVFVGYLGIQLSSFPSLRLRSSFFMINTEKNTIGTENYMATIVEMPEPSQCQVF